MHSNAYHVACPYLECVFNDMYLCLRQIVRVNCVCVVVWSQDVEESASVAVQLTKRGRKAERGGGGGGGGMDVENVREFLRQVETLPCKVPEAKLLEV